MAGPAVGGRRAVFASPRANGRHAAVSRQHPVGPVSIRARCARELRASGSRTDVDTLATVLKAHGYRTGAFVSAFPLDVRFGLARGFDVYDDRYGKGAERAAFREPERAGTATVAAAAAWIAASPKPQAPSSLVRVGPPLRAALPIRAAGAVCDAVSRRRRITARSSAADAALAPLLAPILEQGGNGRTLVVVTGDHGESLGDHGEQTHGLFAYDATLRVPLIVYQPRLFASACRRRSGAARRHSADRARRDRRSLRRKGWTARACLPRCETAGVPTRRRTSRRCPRRSTADGRRSYGVARGPLKYIDLPIPELYDCRRRSGASRGTSRRRARRMCGSCRHCFEQLRASDRGAARTPESAETRERLRQPRLSLRHGGAEDRATPRRTIQSASSRSIAQTDEVITRYQRGDLRGAIALGEEIVGQRPDMAVSLTHLAFLYNEAGDHARAARIANRALELNPAAADVASLLGAYLTDAGLAKEAVARLEPYTRAPQPDLDVLIAYGVALASTGTRLRTRWRPSSARGRSIRRNGLPLTNIGMLYLMAGDGDASGGGVQRGADDRCDARARAQRPGCRRRAARSLRRGRPHWKQAVALDPHDHQALYNLGDVLIRLGRPAEARTYWAVLPARGPARTRTKKTGHVSGSGSIAERLSKKLHQDVAKMILRSL